MSKYGDLAHVEHQKSTVLSANDATYGDADSRYPHRHRRAFGVEPAIDDHSPGSVTAMPR